MLRRDNAADGNRWAVIALAAMVLSFSGSLVPTTASALAEDGRAIEVADFTFPPEWEPHEAVWMGWGSRGGPHPEDLVPLWIEVIAALTPHVQVKLVAGSEEDAADARERLSAGGVDLDRVTLIIRPWTDYWYRDFGPLFITDGAEKKIAEFRWAYYGFPWPYADNGGMRNEEIDRGLAEAYGWDAVKSDFVAEGGGLDVTSDVIVAYEDAARLRNPGKSLEQIEAEYLRLYGKRQVVWLSRAPISDRVFAGPKVANFFGWGANGHVDEYVRFVSDDTVLVAQVPERERDANALLRLDHEILTENIAEMRRARNVDGEPFTVIPVPMPDITALMETRTLTEEDFMPGEGGWDPRSVYRDFKPGDEIHFVPAASYQNFLVTNGVVLVAAYWREGLPEHIRETDEEMRRILAEQFPDREIVQINPLAINWSGGGIHCITQQEPLVATAR